MVSIQNDAVQAQAIPMGPLTETDCKQKTRYPKLENHPNEASGRVFRSRDESNRWCSKEAWRRFQGRRM